MYSKTISIDEHNIYTDTGFSILVEDLCRILIRNGKYRKLLVVDGEFQGSLGLKYPYAQNFGWK